ncbi:MAG: carboxypeptidase-like regulatory domain-containing protein [Planctomycetaceae bacterium]|nr:carboxypeptidase-like regulatory domain-containing protein [Planctomycetaceae bacterium]
MKILKILTCVLFAGMCVAISGCSDSKLKTFPIEGNVTLDGEPLKNASIAFYPQDAVKGNPGYGKTDESGHYTLSTQLGEPGRGTTPGEYKVTVSSQISVPTNQMRRTETGAEVPITNLRETLPPRYSSPGSTELKATIEAKANKELNFDLKSK